MVNKEYLWIILYSTSIWRTPAAQNDRHKNPMLANKNLQTSDSSSSTSDSKEKEMPPTPEKTVETTMVHEVSPTTLKPESYEDSQGEITTEPPAHGDVTDEPPPAQQHGIHVDEDGESSWNSWWYDSNNIIMLNTTDDYKYPNNHAWWRQMRQRWLIMQEKYYSVMPDRNKNQNLKTCYYIATTYKNAIVDLRKYFQVRHLYADTLEYEVGFLSHEIIFRYRIVLELYSLIQRKWEKNKKRNFAPIPYMIYIYTNILQQTKEIMHLCNMIHELEKKYANYFNEVFDDAPAAMLNNHTEIRDKHRLAAIQYQQKRLAKKKAEARERKKARATMLAMGIYTTTARTRSPKKSFWPLHYGWSIEDW